MPDAVSSSDTVVATSGHISSEIAGEEVILDLEDGTYYGLNEVGADVWNLASSPHRVDDICAVLTDEYDVERKVLKRDVVDLLADMRKHGLIRVVSA
jgi:hypothetical protein